MAGAFLVLNALCSWYYMIYCFLFTAIFLVYQLIVNRQEVFERRFIAQLGRALLLFLIVMSPLLVRMTYAYFTQEFTGEHNPEVWSADLLSFLVPSGISTWGQLWFEGVWSKWSGNTAENSNYLGYIVLALSIYALVYIPKCRFWGFAGALFWVLALGPYLRVMGNQIRIPLPYLVLHKYLPFFAFTGVPERFDIMLKLCMAVLASYAIFDLISTYLPGANEWLKLYPHKASETANLIRHRWQVSGWEVLAVVGLGAFICLEYLAIPYTTTKVDVPQFYHQMAADNEAYGVIDTHPNGAMQLYYATIHGKPLVGGYVSRPPTQAIAFLDQTPIVATLLRNKPEPPPNTLDAAVDTLNRYNIRYIITHGNQHQSFLDGVLRLPQVYTGDEVQVYDCRQRRVEEKAEEATPEELDSETIGSNAAEAD